MAIWPIFTYLQKNGLLPDRSTIICELGCNDGRVLDLFYKNGFKVLGIDRDAEAISRARESFPEGIFEVGDVSIFTAPTSSFVIIRNVLSFLKSKAVVDALLDRHKSHGMLFTFFGKNDELASSNLWWDREEVKGICKRLGARIIDESNGMTKNMKGNPRRTHVFYCLKA